VPGSFADVSIAVDVHAIDPLQGDYISVICRSEDPADRYEFLLLPQSGIFVIERWLHNERAQLTASRTSPAVLSGDRTNHVELSCSGTRITATVNGALVASAADNTFRAGQVGFGIGSFSNQAASHETRFSDVVALQR
jgi:hypothetical protein